MEQRTMAAIARNDNRRFPCSIHPVWSAFESIFASDPGEALMLGYWPPAYQDELFYSICARYKTRLDIPRHSDVCKDIFNSELKCSITDFPVRLEELGQNLPSSVGFNAEEVIWANTPLPFYAPFMLREQVAHLIYTMIKGSPDSPLPRIRVSGTDRPFRYCRDCVINDRRNEETYWRRLHQTPCVLVCPVHRTALLSTDLRSSDTYKTRPFFVSAEDAIPNNPLSHTNDLVSSDRSSALWLAEQVQWLLEHPRLTFGQYDLAKAYHSRLEESGFAPRGRKIWDKLLTSALVKRFHPTFLRELGVDVLPRNSQWIRKVGSLAVRPVLHLLVLRLLDLDVGTFFTNVHATTYFEPGPWPCLNPACAHCEQDVIASYEVRFSEDNIYGIFSCDCGYTYSRKASDKTGRFRTEPYRVIVRGGQMGFNAF